MEKETWRRRRKYAKSIISISYSLSASTRTPHSFIPRYSAKEIDLENENVDTEWMAYVGGLVPLRTLNLADCWAINSSTLWPIAGSIWYLLLVLVGFAFKFMCHCDRDGDFEGAGIGHLLSMPNLEDLCNSETGVTENGVALLCTLVKVGFGWAPCH